MADTRATELGSCNEEIPLLGVTREFDFGQFIELFDSAPDPKAPGIPIISRVVIQTNATLAAEGGNGAGSAPPSAAVASVAQSATGTQKTAQKAKMKTAGAATVLGPEQAPGSLAQPEVDLFALTGPGLGAKRTPVLVEVTDIAAFLKSGVADVDGTAYKVEISDAMQTGLGKGLSFTVQGTPLKGEGAVTLQLYPSFQPVKLTAATMARVIAGGGLEGAGSLRPMMTQGAIRTLLSGAPVLTHGTNDAGLSQPLVLVPPATESVPRGDSFQVFDTAAFLSDPQIPATDGGWIPLKPTQTQVSHLLEKGRTTLPAGKKTVEIVVIPETSPDYKDYLSILDELISSGRRSVKPFGETWKFVITLPDKYQNFPPHFVHPFTPEPPARGVTVVGSGGGGGVPVAALASMADKVQPRLPGGTGLPVAVFVPWKQTWTLKGFSRGNLLSTIALAPSEQLTMQISSWERRTRTLEQSSETDIDQQTDIDQSTRDTEDVFKEMLAKRDFAWQLSGSIDASYSPGVATISVHAGGSVNQTDSIQNTARNSSQSVRESTIKASSRVRSKRVTRVTQSVESGKEERVTRVIRNPNQCHTLTLDFFETLAHYEINLAFQQDRLRLVALLPNPVKIPDFDSLVVRRNETALRNALIETALEDGFEACRLTAAYEEAKTLITEQKSDAVKTDAIDLQRTDPPNPAAESPSAPQEAEVLRVMSEMVNALKRIRAEAGIDEALTKIRYNEPVTETMRRKGQQWLFINFCAAKFPALLAVLDDIANGGATGINAAQKILSVLPRPDAPVNLGNLNQMSDADKEGACLASKLKEYDSQKRRRFMQIDWDWGWWVMRLKEEAFYTANDGGLSGGADQLQRAYQSWEAKKAQGDAMKDQEVAKTEAEGKQDKTTTEDKLSMAFPIEDMARARERMKVLFAHLNEHKDFYNYSLFQALPPSEQVLKIVEASNGRLSVGLFEPRVVAMSGAKLVVPLTPMAGSEQLKTFLTSLGNNLANTFADTLKTPDTTVLPTPGVSVSSRLGKCTGCEEFIEESRKLELVRLSAVAQQAQAEADRRKARIEAKDLEPFEPEPAAVKLQLENK